MGAFWIANDAMMQTTKTLMDAHAVLNLRWAHMSEGTFAHVVAQMDLYNALVGELSKTSNCTPLGKV